MVYECRRCGARERVPDTFDAFDQWDMLLTVTRGQECPGGRAEAVPAARVGNEVAAVGKVSGQ